MVCPSVREIIYSIELVDCHISLVIIWSFFPFQNNPKNLEPSYKMVLDLWDCLGRVKTCIIAKFKGLI